MNNKIYIHLDFFSPSVYLKPKDNSEGPIFLILQPYIFTRPEMDCPDLAIYIAELAKDTPGSFDYVIIDETNKLHIDQQNTWSTAVPVPLPFNVVMTCDDNRINSMGGEHGYRFETPQSQLQWMIDSMSSTSITVEDFFGTLNFIRLNANQKDKWWNALLVVLTNYTKKNDAGTGYEGVKIGEAETFTAAMLNNKVDPTKKSLHELLAIIEQSKNIAVPIDFTNEKDNALKNYIAAINSIAEPLKKTIVPLLQVPSVTLSKTNLEQIRDGATDAQIAVFTSNQLGYLRNLGLYFNNILTSKLPENQKLTELVDGLKKYFLYGERTRIANPLPTNFHMLPITDVDQQADRFSTPAVSLAGQVIDLSKAGACKIGNTPIFNTNFADSVSAIQKNTRENHAGSFSRPLEFMQVIPEHDWNHIEPYATPEEFRLLRAAHANLGKASFMPSNALATQAASFPNVDDEILFQVPQSIIDGLQEAGRVGYTANFAKSNPSRKAITYPNEVINYSIAEKNVPAVPDHLTTFRPGLMIKVTITPVKLPGTNGASAMHKISAKAEDSYNSPFEGRLRAFIIEKVIRNINEFQFYLLDGIEPTKFTPLLDEKVDDDELVEIYAMLEASKFKNQQYDLLITPVNAVSFWSSGEVHFNVLLKKTPEIRPLIIQRNYFHFKYNHSSNGLNTYVKLGLKKSEQFTPIPVVDSQPVMNDHSNFNKFRITIDQSTPNAIMVNKADALTPLLDYIEGDPHSSSDVIAVYKVLHRFSEELADFADTQGRGLFETEWNRYLLYRAAGTLHTLTGKAENQYAFRLPTQQMPGVSLPNSTTVSNPALLSIKESDGVSVYALTYSLDSETKKIRLSLNTRYFDLFKAQFNPADPKKQETGSAYRPLYEAFVDFMQSSETRLTVEGWDFDNNQFNLPVDAAVHPELANEIPSHVRYLRRVGKDIDLNLTAFRSDINNFFDKPNLLDFATAVKSFSGDMVANFDLPPTLQSASFVRLRLTIFRAKEKSVAANFDPNVPANELTQESWVPLLSDINSKEYSIAFSAIDDACAQMKKVITPPGASEIEQGLPIGGDLFYSSAFITVSLVGKNKDYIELPSNTKLREQLKLVLGENRSFTAFNYLVKEPVPAGAVNYGDLFYIPYAIVPLKTLPELGNATETLGFSLYLLKILISLAYPAKAQEDLQQLVGSVDWPADNNASQKEKFRLMNEMRATLRNTIAPKLAALVTYVDDRDIERNLPANYLDLTSIYSSINLTSTVERYFKSLFTAKPELFITSKGFGLGLIRNAKAENGQTKRLRFDELYSLQVHKVIKHTEGSKLARKINSTFDFTSIFKADALGHYRIFVDVLDDEMYDNEFEIIADENSLDPGINVKHHRRVPAHDTDQNRYVRATPAGENLNLIHYIDDWDKHYLLPSRRPPQKPVAQEVFNMVNYKNGNNPAQPEQIADIMRFEIDTLLRTRHDDYPKDSNLDTAATITQRLKTWTSADIVAGMKKGYLTDIKVNDAPTAKWRRHDTCISLYSFAIDPDEEKVEANGAKPLSGFENDKIRVYWSDVGEESDRQGPAAVTRVEVKKFNDAYQIYKKRKGQELTDEEKKPKITLSDLEHPQHGLIQNLVQCLEALHTSPQEVNARTSGEVAQIVVTSDGTLNGFKLISDGAVVVSATVYVDVTKTQNNEPVMKHYLILAVITHPWERKKLRIQVDRNVRDFNNDNDADINPMFEMFSEFSEWVDHGQVLLQYNFWDGDGLDNRQLNPYPPELTRIRFDSTVQSNYDLDIDRPKVLPGFFSKLFPADQFDRAELEQRPIAVLVSHRTATNQVIMLSKQMTASPLRNFLVDVNTGLRAYRDELTRQSNILEPGSRVDLSINEDVKSVYPFIRVGVLNKEKSDALLAINVQVQWESDPN